MNEENKKEVIINIALLISLILLCIMIFFNNYKNHHNIRYMSVKDSPFTYDMIGEWNNNDGKDVKLYHVQINGCDYGMITRINSDNISFFHDFKCKICKGKFIPHCFSTNDKISENFE